MNRQLISVVTTLLITAFAGIGLTASAQDPCCPQPVSVAQPVSIAQPVHQQPLVCAQACCQQTCGSCTAASADMEDLVKRIEKGADKFEDYFKDSLKCIGDGCDFDTYKGNVDAFEEATDRLRKDYDDDCNVGMYAQEVLRLAECVSAYIDPCSLCPEAVNEWNELRANLESLACQTCNTLAWAQPISLQPACAQPACIQAQPVAIPVAVPVAVPVAPQPVCCPNN